MDQRYNGKDRFFFNQQQTGVTSSSFLPDWADEELPLSVHLFVMHFSVLHPPLSLIFRSPSITFILSWSFILISFFPCGE